MPDLTPPPWVEAKEGTPESLRSNKATERELAAFLARNEAVSMQESMGRGEMNDEQRFLVGYVNQEIGARANLELATDRAVIVQYERMLAMALHKQGRNAEALAALTILDSESATLRERIKAIIAAIDKPDAELHSHQCKRRAEDGMEIDRRVAIDEVYSIPHGGLVTVYRCTQCGELNATPEVPERQRDRAEMRLKARRMLVASKEPVNLRQFSDVELLSDAAV